MRGQREVLRWLSTSRSRRGEVTGLLGPSGCGKSTLMRALVGVQQAHGRLGPGLRRSRRASTPLRDRVGYVTQAASVYDDLTVAENLPSSPRSSASPADEVDRCIEAVDLGSHADQVVGNLSGGQRSRASLAVALLGEPDLLVLDEPTVGLDPVLRQDLWALFHRIADGGAAVFVSSHVMDEAERCDRLLLMRDGVVIADDSPHEIKSATGTRRHRAGLPGPRARRRRHEPPHHCSPSPRRVLTQLRRDHRTLAMLLVLPCLLISLLWWMFDGPRRLTSSTGSGRPCWRCSRSS